MSHSPQPLIGLTGGLTRNKSGAQVCQVGQAYITAIQKAGAVPVMIPVGLKEDTLTTLLDRVDGLLLTGGGDIDPQHFNGDPNPNVYGISPERDALEFFLVKQALASNKPLLAICRGIQVLNVALGGSLYTHIQDQIAQSLKHDWFPKFPRDKLAHTVSLVCDSKLQDIFGEADIRVNSLHHQGIARVGEGLKATAFAPDGLVEGLEVEHAEFALGVQWHPECLPEDAGMQKLFKTFVEKASSQQTVQ